MGGDFPVGVAAVGLAQVSSANPELPQAVVHPAQAVGDRRSSDSTRRLFSDHLQGFLQFSLAISHGVRPSAFIGQCCYRLALDDCRRSTSTGLAAEFFRRACAGYKAGCCPIIALQCAIDALIASGRVRRAPAIVSIIEVAGNVWAGRHCPASQAQAKFIVLVPAAAINWLIRRREVRKSLSPCKPLAQASRAQIGRSSAKVGECPGGSAPVVLGDPALQQRLKLLGCGETVALKMTALSDKQQVKVVGLCWVSRVNAARRRPLAFRDRRPSEQQRMRLSSGCPAQALLMQAAMAFVDLSRRRQEAAMQQSSLEASRRRPGFLVQIASGRFVFHARPCCRQQRMANSSSRHSSVRRPPRLHAVQQRVARCPLSLWARAKARNRNGFRLHGQ